MMSLLLNWLLFLVLLFAPAVLIRCIERKRQRKI